MILMSSVLCRFRHSTEDFTVYTRKEKSANRGNWIERKLFLKVSLTKTNIAPSGKSEFLGFEFWNDNGIWKCRPLMGRKQRIRNKLREATCRCKAAAIPLSITVTKAKQILMELDKLL